jgi:hypothetical protein
MLRPECLSSRPATRCLAAALAPALLLFAAPARADVLQPGSTYGEISAIGKGVKEAGVESLFVTTFDKQGDASSFQLTFLGGLTFRYFIVENLGLSITVGGLFDTSSSIGKRSDFGGSGTLNAAYYAKLGGGMMLAPTIGIGGFGGGRTEEQAAGEVRSSLFGGIARGGLGLVFYPGSRVNLFARPEAIAFFGSAKPAPTDALPEPEGAFFVRVNGGFSVGVHLVF